MTLRTFLRLLVIGILSIALVNDMSFAAGRGGGGRGGGGRGGGGGSRGGGGGSRGGGGGGGARASRPSYSGSGSVRYSSPRSSSSGARSAGSSYSRPSGSAVGQRPSGGYGTRTTTPSARPSTPAAAQRPAGGYGTRTTTPSARPGGATAAQRPATPSYQPANNGSLIHSGSVTTPRGSTISGAVGPRGGGAVSVDGARGGSAAGVRTARGGGAAVAEGPRGGAAAGVRGPGGGGAAVAEGPRGGTAAGVRGPGGGGAAVAEGPRGGTAAAVRGPGGAGAAGVRGPYGGAAGAVWGPGGHGYAAGYGRYGNAFVTNLPVGAAHYPWNGGDYWHVGFSWYSPVFVGDSMYYGTAYPPAGYYYPSLPESSTQVTIDNSTYYESEGVYYQEGEENGQKGYVVVEAPEGAAAAEEPAGENPFNILKSMCDYVAGLNTFSMVAQTTADEVGPIGEKVHVSAKRTIYVSRPDKVAVDVAGDKGERRIVYDGKTVSMFDRTNECYTVVQVPDTIDATLDTLAQDYGIVVPLEDLMYKDFYDRAVARITAGQYLGLTTMDGDKCHHLAFSTDTASWEVWIKAGDKPEPRMIAIDYGQNAARTRYSADITGWVGSPTLKAERFKFDVPAGAQRIELTPKSKKG